MLANKNAEERQSGYYEPLLCRICDNSFGKYFDEPSIDFIRELPSSLPVVNGRLPPSIRICFPWSFRRFILSVIYRSIFAKHLSWSKCAQAWNPNILKGILSGRIEDNTIIYAHVLAYGINGVGDGGRPVMAGEIPRGLVIAPHLGNLNPNLIPIKMTQAMRAFPFTCMTLGGLEVLAQMQPIGTMPHYDDIPQNCSPTDIFVSDIFRQSLFAEDVRKRFGIESLSRIT